MKVLTKAKWLVSIAAAVLLCAPALNAGYAKQRTIADCQSSLCPANQTNFTELVCFNSTLGNGNACPTAADLAVTGSGGQVTSSSGYDIVFSSTTCDSPTPLHWEMEKYVGSTGEVKAWVLIPSLLAISHTFYVCYGNAAMTSFQGGASSGAWDSGYQGVWHLPNGSSLTATDSTSHANNGTLMNAPTATAGQIDGAANFVNTSSQYIDVGTSSSLNPSTALTISAWVNFTTDVFPADAYQIFARDASGQRAYNLSVNGGGKPNLDVLGDNGDDVIGETFELSTNSWYYFSGDYTLGGLKNFYTNGSVSNSSSVGNTALNTSTDSSKIGARGYLGFQDYMLGLIDEVRFSNVARSANWVATEYANEGAPATFFSVGSATTVVTPTGTMVRLIMF